MAKCWCLPVLATSAPQDLLAAECEVTSLDLGHVTSKWGSASNPHCFPFSYRSVSNLVQSTKQAKYQVLFAPLWSTTGKNKDLLLLITDLRLR